MAIIYSYPKKTTPSAGDFLVITDSDQEAPDKNRTKSLTVGDLSTFILSSAGTVTGTGTANTLTKWNSAGTGIQDSIVFTSGDGSNVGIVSPAITPQRTIHLSCRLNT